MEHVFKMPRGGSITPVAAGRPPLPRVIHTRINCGTLDGVGTRVYLKIMIRLSGSVFEALHSASQIANVNARSLHSRAHGIDFNDREPLGHS